MSNTPEGAFLLTAAMQVEQPRRSPLTRRGLLLALLGGGVYLAYEGFQYTREVQDRFEILEVAAEESAAVLGRLAPIQRRMTVDILPGSSARQKFGDVAIFDAYRLVTECIKYAELIKRHKVVFRSANEFSVPYVGWQAYQEILIARAAVQSNFRRLTDARSPTYLYFAHLDNIARGGQDLHEPLI